MLRSGLSAKRPYNREAWIGLVALSLLTSLALAPGAMAGEPAAAGSPPPRTAAEEAALQVKLAAAAQEQQQTMKLLSTSLVESCPFGPVEAGAVRPMNVICDGHYGFLTTYWRHQEKPIYCGPAAVQVVSNYAWGYTTGNRWSQQTISNNWTNTDADGQTLVYREKNGLNGASAGHMPSGFIYAYYVVTSGVNWHNYLRTDINTYEMPQVDLVAPHDTDAQYFLYSWRNTRVNTGHYIVLGGWDTVWNGSMSDSVPTVEYDDGSRGLGGGDGTFTDPARTVYYTLHHQHPYPGPYRSPDYIIW